MTGRLLATVATLAAVAPLAAPSALAGGYYYPDSGIVAYGRGGAFVASADNQFAQYYNPAGLERIERPTVNLGLSGVQQHVTFTRQLEDGSFAEPVSNEEAPFLIPQIGFATPIGDRVGFAFGFTSPFAPGYQYPADGPQRYTLIDSLVWNFSVGPSVAWRPIDQVAIGGSLQWQALRVEQELKVTLSGEDDPESDVGVDVAATDWFTPNFNAGVLIDPVEALSIGLSVQPPTRFRATGPGELDFSQWSGAGGLDQETYRDEEVALNLTLPLVVRAGVAVRPVAGLEIELASTWERWNTLEEILVEDIDITVNHALIGEQPIDDTISLPAGFQDTVSLRLGGEYAVDDMFTVRAGGLWERPSLPRSRQSVTLYDPTQVLVGAGGSALVADHLGIDLSLAWMFMPDQAIRDSEVEQINAFDEEDTMVVGNGDYSSKGWMIGTQFSWAFGAP